MKRRGRTLRRSRERKVTRLGMNRRQLLLVLEEQPRDVVREIVWHCTIHDQHVRHADDGDRRGDSGVGARWDLESEIEIAIRLTERREQIARSARVAS